jgi:hypothetical protein
MNHFRAVLARAGVFGLVLVPAGTAAPPQAAAAPDAHSCGAVIKSVVKTETFALFTTQSTTFVNLPGAAVNVTVPAGETRCVKARLSVIGQCSETAAFDLCAVRMVGSVTLDPPVNGVDMVTPSNGGHGAFTFQWVKRLEAGTHTIRPQVAVQNAMTTFSIKTWTYEVETSE